MVSVGIARSKIIRGFVVDVRYSQVFPRFRLPRARPRTAECQSGVESYSGWTPGGPSVPRSGSLVGARGKRLAARDPLEAGAVAGHWITAPLSNATSQPANKNKRKTIQDEKPVPSGGSRGQGGPKEGPPPLPPPPLSKTWQGVNGSSSLDIVAPLSQYSMRNSVE